MAIISCGVFDRKYIYFILSYALIMILFATTLLIINGNLEDVKIYNNVLLSLLLSNFGLIFCYIPELITKKLVSDKKEKNINRNNTFKFQLFKNEKKKLAIEYIFNDFSTKIAVKDMIFIFICSLLLIVIDYLKIFIQKQNVEEDQLILNEQYNYIQLLFIVIFAYFFYKMRFYKHQIYSILIIIILGIIRYIIKIFHYYEWKKPNICFDLFLQIIIAIFESIVIIFAKALMEIKYFSPYKVCYTFGIINSIIILILLIIFSFIKKNTTNWFFSLDYEGAYYLDNINFIFYEYGYKLIGLFFCSIFYALLKLLLNLTINNYTVCHAFLLLQNKEITSNISNELKSKKGFIFVGLLLLTHLIEFFVILVFLEIIELNFCNLDENIRRNIKDRADRETRGSIKDIDDNLIDINNRNESDASYTEEEENS